MNRRAFFGLIAGGMVAAADPDRLLWVPGRKVISIPAARLSEDDLAYLYLRPAFIAIADRIDRDLCSAAPAFYVASHKQSPNDVLMEVVPSHRGFPMREYAPWWRHDLVTQASRRSSQ